MKRFAFLAFLGLFLSACAGAVPWNDQNKAGITRAEVKWCESKDQSNDRYVCGLRVWDGKEKADVNLNAILPGGLTISYNARGVRAFKAHEVRAAIEAAVSNDVKVAAPGIVGNLVKAVMGLGL